MKNTLRLFALLALMVPVLQSCGDDDSDGGGSKTKTEYLTSGSWKLTSATLNGVDMMVLMDDCDKDDFRIFNSDKTGMLDAGATKCDENDPQSEDFTWTFNDSETELTFDGETGTIDKLDGSTLQVSLSDPDLGLSVVQTFKH